MRRTGVAARVVAVCVLIVVSYGTAGAADESSKREKQKQGDDKNVAGACASDGFPIRAGNPISCCRDGNRSWHTNDGKTLVFRVYATPCTEADGVGTNCSGRACLFGPCGAKIEWAVTAEEVHIFKPVSKPETCGWEVKNVIGCRVGCDWPAGAVRRHPEPFVSQKEYPGVTATCPFTDCLSGGTPTK